MNTKNLQIKEKLASLQPLLTSHNQEKLLTYIHLLTKWNKTYNLIAKASEREILTQHILDSLSITPYIYGTRILDVGTGAGLPGIPLALALPEKQFTLLDSIGKKTRFLQQVKTELKLLNVQIINARAENYHPENCFATIVTRALASVSDTITLAAHLLCPAGRMLLMKGRYPDQELKGINWDYQVIPLQIPGLDKERHLVILKGKMHD